VLATGLTCFHPDVPRFIALTVGQRIPPGARVIRTDWEVRPFLEKLEFKPLALARGPSAEAPCLDFRSGARSDQPC